LPSAAVLLVHSNAASLPMPAAALASVVPSRCVSRPVGRFTLFDVRSSFKGQLPGHGTPVLPESSWGLRPGSAGVTGGVPGFGSSFVIVPAATDIVPSV
jgi:hypothetical protein